MAREHVVYILDDKDVQEHDTIAVKSPLYDTRHTSYDKNGNKFLEFLIDVFGEKRWVIGQECIPVARNANLAKILEEII